MYIFGYLCLLTAKSTDWNKNNYIKYLIIIVQCLKGRARASVNFSFEELIRSRENGRVRIAWQKTFKKNYKKIKKEAAYSDFPSYC